MLLISCNYLYAKSASSAYQISADSYILCSKNEWWAAPCRAGRGGGIGGLSDAVQEALVSLARRIGVRAQVNDAALICGVDMRH